LLEFIAQESSLRAKYRVQTCVQMIYVNHVYNMFVIKKKKNELDIAKEILFCGGFAKGC
jgi:hypothetical protein